MSESPGEVTFSEAFLERSERCAMIEELLTARLLAEPRAGERTVASWERDVFKQIPDVSSSEKRIVHRVLERLVEQRRRVDAFMNTTPDDASRVALIFGFQPTKKVSIERSSVALRITFADRADFESAWSKVNNGDSPDAFSVSAKSSGLQEKMLGNSIAVFSRVDENGVPFPPEELEKYALEEETHLLEYTILDVTRRALHLDDFLYRKIGTWEDAYGGTAVRIPPERTPSLAAQALDTFLLYDEHDLATELSASIRSSSTEEQFIALASQYLKLTLASAREKVVKLFEKYPIADAEVVMEAIQEIFVQRVSVALVTLANHRVFDEPNTVVKSKVARVMRYVPLSSWSTALPRILDRGGYVYARTP